MATLTEPQLKTFVASVVTKAKLSSGSFSETRDNTAGLLDKIGKIVTLDTVYQIDKLADFDGEYLSFGKTIEEWNEDLTLAEDYDPTGANALAPHDPTYRPAFYSYTVGRKEIPTTIRYNDFERAVHLEAQYVELVAMKFKRMQDSMAVYRYGVKREMIAKFIALIDDQISNSNATFVASTAYTVGTLLKDGGSPNKHGIVFRPIAVADALANWAAAVSGGFIVELDGLVQEIAVPVDESTGEAFIKQVKQDVERASDQNVGNSLNGNYLGATAGLTLLIKQGIIPSIEVDTLAGAFHDGNLAIPAKIIVVKDFGSDATDAYAVLMDSRAMRLHNTYRAMREQINAKGDFSTYYDHTEDTAYISRNVFVKVYRKPA